VWRGDAAFDKSDFNASAGETVCADFVFTAFAHRNEWDGQKKPQEVSTFFSIYQQTYHTNLQYADLPYADTILVYNAGTSNGPDIQKALAGFDQCHPVQGVSGALAFAPDGNPIQKVIVVLTVTKDGIVQFPSQGIQQGQLFANTQQQC
jgi:hypothetical protein